MKIRNLVRETNPITYSIIKNAKRNKTLSHAYLISAGKKDATINVAAFLLQAITCLKEGLVACGECQSCIKVTNGQYADLKVLDGTENLIKKHHVIDATTSLKQTPFEKSGKRILLIKNIENSNKQSINSLLKFIEEPTKDTFIIMTTNSIQNVLPTIKSRAQLLKLKPKNIDIFTNELKANRINSKYARLLAHIVPDLKTAIEYYETDFIEVHKQVEDFIYKLSKDKAKAAISLNENLTKKSNYKLYLEILEQFLNDIWRIKVGKEIVCKKVESEAKLLSEIEFDFSNAIEKIWTFKNNLLFNVNFDLSREEMSIGMLR